ncbi:MAG TPA: SufS family cysteine desulfurase [Pyrinomonadaceae bacterium]|jgi:cysteine desulfurase/selenocysteine lyase
MDFAKERVTKKFDVEKIRADFPMLKQKVNGKPLVYLDNSASSQKPQVMIDRLCDFYTNEYAKIDEIHSLSKKATENYEQARGKVAKLINAHDAKEIIFERGATEALSRLANSFARSILKEGDEILITAMEHHSNLVPWHIACGESGAKLKVAPINEKGELLLDEFESKLTERTKVVAVTHVSNVLGTINPIKQICEMAYERNIRTVIDGAQSAAHLPVDVQDLNCDFYAVSGHKMGGPSSVGFLYGKAAWLDRLPPIEGGSVMAETVTFEDFETKPLPKKIEAGTPSFAEAIAYGAAVDYWSNLGLENIAEYEKELLAYATEKVRAIDRVKIIGEAQDKISVLSFTIDGIEPNKIEETLDKEGIAIRSGTLSAQPLMKVLGVSGVARASFMFYNTPEEAAALAAGIEKCIKAAG